MADNDDQVATQDTLSGQPAATIVTPQSMDTNGAALFDPNKIGILDEVMVAVSIEIGRAQIKIRDLLNLTKDSIIDLDKLAGEPVDVYVNGKLISKGNIITVNGKYCVRLISIPNTNISNPKEG